MFHALDVAVECVLDGRPDVMTPFGPGIFIFRYV
jgi:hypothetical protein